MIGAIIAKRGFQTAFFDITDWTVHVSDAANEQVFIPFTIDAVGGTGYVDLYVLADTNDALALKTISTTLSGGNNIITWSDGVTNNITALDDAPIKGATVTY